MSTRSWSSIQATTTQRCLGQAHLPSSGILAAESLICVWDGEVKAIRPRQTLSGPGTDRRSVVTVRTVFAG
jgi:hypothetical protein